LIISVRAHTHTHTHTHTYVCARTQTHILTHERTRKYIEPFCIYLDIYIQTRIQTQTCTQTHTKIQTHTHTTTHTCAHTHTRTYTYCDTHTHSLSLSRSPFVPLFLFRCLSLCLTQPHTQIRALANTLTHKQTLSQREIECLLNDSHQKGKMMIMITNTSGSQVDSPVAEGKRKEGGGRKIRDLHKDT